MLTILFEDVVSQGIITPIGESTNFDAARIRAFFSLCWAVVKHTQITQNGSDISWRDLVPRTRAALGPAHELNSFIHDPVSQIDLIYQRLQDGSVYQAGSVIARVAASIDNPTDEPGYDFAQPPPNVRKQEVTSRKSLFTREDFVEFEKRWTRDAVFALYEAVLPLSIEQVSTQKIPQNLAQVIWSITEILVGRSSRTLFPDGIQYIEFNPRFKRVVDIFLRDEVIKNILEIYARARKLEKSRQEQQK